MSGKIWGQIKAVFLALPIYFGAQLEPSSGSKKLHGKIKHSSQRG